MKASDIEDAHVIRLAAAWREGSALGVVAALQAEGVPYKVAFHKVEKMSSRHLLDYGVSPHYAWPTPEGLALLRKC